MTLADTQPAAVRLRLSLAQWWTLVVSCLAALAVWAPGRIQPSTTAPHDDEQNVPSGNRRSR
ncbi:hypothetical protein H7H69_12005 [Mycobacterium heckeshornense]|uniref:hypothetical protein n=1 Tax=Mycobacterium heckeshornense TaxID=110505 RepID=UPI000AAB0FD6|nr:hypothetical protein [Mycobacterium heckeshornense]MCV7034915.1 hypothetical protein [Mycobacterium heckeshornense]